MAVPGPILREIHRLRRNAKDLVTRIEQGPRLLKGHKATVARAEEILKAAQDQLKQLKVHTHEKEVSLKATLGQLEKWDKQMQDIISKKEYEALRVESTHAREQVGKLEDDILTGMGEAEEQAA